MDTPIIALKLLLDGLNVSNEIGTVADRKRLQKAVYLGQVKGVDLGYRYGWYLKGPYCPSLARDYYKLSEALEVCPEDFRNWNLHPTLVANLVTARGLLEKPADVTLAIEDWLELLASYHFLRKIRGLPDGDACSTLQKEKPHVFPYAQRAKEWLEQHQAL